MPAARTRQRILKNGTRVVLAAANDNVPEWRLQAAQVRALRAMPEHGRLFLLAGDQNAARRGPRAAELSAEPRLVRRPSPRTDRIDP